MHFETPVEPKKRAVAMSDEDVEMKAADEPVAVESSTGLGEGVAAVEELTGVSWNTTDTTLKNTPKVGRLAVLQSPGGEASLDDRNAAFSISQVYKLSNQNKLLQRESKDKREKDRDGEGDGEGVENVKRMKTDAEFMSSIGWTGSSTLTPTDSATASGKTAGKDSKDSKEKTPFVYNPNNTFTNVDVKTLATSAKDGQQGFYNPFATVQGQSNIGKTRVNGKKGGKK